MVFLTWYNTPLHVKAQLFCNGRGNKQALLSSKNSLLIHNKCEGSLI
uniref:Uncharacterized protein n=1 Tax=Rhizophora mucronata TaxID=61149 RepID=A0A2P2NPE6_RHIMU